MGHANYGHQSWSRLNRRRLSLPNCAESLAKLDLHSGTYTWQREVDKQDAPAFAEFQLPEIHGERATFY